MVQVVDDAQVGVDRAVTYATAAGEKLARASLKATVERHLDAQTVVHTRLVFFPSPPCVSLFPLPTPTSGGRDRRQVVVDSLNYIKGFRYELYCVARSARTPHCVVSVLAAEADCAAWNAARAAAGEPAYPPAVLGELVQRFEEPNANNRWDHPVFAVAPGDASPGPAVRALMAAGPVARPAQATQSQRLAGATFLHDLDRVTQDLVTALLQAQALGGLVPGDTVALPGCAEKVAYRRAVTMAELRRLRQQVWGWCWRGARRARPVAYCGRQFVAFSKTHPADKAESIGPLFVQFLNSSIA